MAVYIVVPDGLAANDNGAAISEPSFVFKSVLDFTASLATKEDTLYIAPANNFGCAMFEQEVAAKYLTDKVLSSQIIAPIVKNKGYIDTFGNAAYLKGFLKHNQLTTRFDLICSEIHSYRAQLCFKVCGYDIHHVYRVKYKNSKEPVVRRLWYYRYPVWYIAYEMLAIIRELFLFPFKSMRSN